MGSLYNTENKIVQWNDNGITRLSMLPVDAPDEDAPLGIQIGFHLDQLDYPHHFKMRLHQCLWERGYKTAADFKGNMNSLEDIRRCLQSLIRADANDVYQAIINGDTQ